MKNVRLPLSEYESASSGWYFGLGANLRVVNLSLDGSSGGVLLPHPYYASFSA